MRCVAVKWVFVVALVVGVGACGASKEVQKPSVNPPTFVEAPEGAPDLGGTRTQLSFGVMCTREACQRGVCCNSCTVDLQLKVDGGPHQGKIWSLANHGCVVDGCGRVQSCTFEQGPFTLPKGSWLGSYDRVFLERLD